MSKESGNQVYLPINPKDVFRLLALRSVYATEVFWEKLADLSTFNSIYAGITTTPRLDRDKPFAYTHSDNASKLTHNNKPGNLLFEEMTERELCSSKKAFFLNNFGDIGHVIDYELPLDDKRDSAFGEVDLVSVTDSELFLLEVKKVKSNEHPLRAMFEIFTFWKMLADKDAWCKNSKEVCFSQFLQKYSTSNNGEKTRHVCPNRVRPGLLFYKGSTIYNQLKDSLEHPVERQAEHALYKHFLDSPIEMKVFVYDYDEAHISNVQDMTDGIKEKLGLK